MSKEFVSALVKVAGAWWSVVLANWLAKWAKSLVLKVKTVELGDFLYLI